jgi:hypothetical protein
MLFISICFITNAQIEFAKVYSDLGFEKGEGIAQLSDSSYLITGSSTSFGDGPPQAFLMKLDSLGNHQWAKHYGGSEINEGKRVFPIENYGYYIGGNTNSNSNADHNFYLVKTDENGDPLFEKQIGTPAWDFVHDGILLADSSILLTGETYNTNDGQEDRYTIRFDKYGDTIWTSQSHTPGKDKIYAAENIGDTAFVLAGTVWNADSLTHKAFLGFYKYDNSIIWEKEYGTNGDYEIRDVEYWNNVFHCVGNRVFIADSLKDEYVIRVNLNGDSLSGYSYLASSDKSINKIVQYGSSNKFYLATSFIDQYSYGTGEDLFISKHTDFFTYDFSYLQFKANGQDDIGQFIKTSDGGAVIVGTNRSLGTQNANVFVLKIGENDTYPNTNVIPVIYSLVEIENIQIPNEGYDFYPNPTSEILNIKGNIQSCQLKIINTTGQISETFQLNSQIEKINISNLETGIYFLVLTKDEGESHFLGRISKY